jgi:hypothetical protein
MKTETKITEDKKLEKAIKLLISLYNNESTNSQYPKTENEFHCYVQDFAQEIDIALDEITESQLRDCAENFILYDGGDYLL